VGTDRGLYACANLSQKGKSPKIWKQIGGEIFAGQSVQAIVIPSWDPYQLYVGTNVGLYRSDDSGMEWRQINLKMLKETPSPESSMEVFLETSLPQLPIQDIACSSVAARTIYIASNQSVYQSTDDGKTWSLMSLESPEEQLINALTVVTFNGNEQLYAGTSSGVYQWQSQTGWKKISAPAELTTSSSVLLRASLSQQQIFYAGNNTLLYRSMDAGTKWEIMTQAERGMLFELEKHPAFGGREVVNRVQEYLTTKLPTLAQTGSEFVGTLVKHFTSIALGFGGFLATAFLALIVFIYASQSLNSYVQRLINLFPQDNRDTIKLYLTEIDQNLQSFLRGQVAVILIISIISIAVYSIIGVPFALVVGLLAGVCNAIPTIGPFIGGAFAMLSLLMGFAAGNFEAAGFLIRIVALLGAILGIQAIDNSLISPKVMSSAVNVDPLLIMLGVIVGASVLGFWGVLLAIPIIVVIKSVLTVSKAIRT
jgi:predicted PurR-regulated permease PerM